MPLYEFVDKQTGIRIEKLVSMDGYNEFLLTNPHLTPVIGAPRQIDPVRLSRAGHRTSEGFQEVLKKAKNAHPLGTIETR